MNANPSPAPIRRGTLILAVAVLAAIAGLAYWQFVRTPAAPVAADAPIDLSPQALDRRLLSTEQELAKLARERAALGLGWQGALDAVRPHVTAIWRAWNPEQRRAFLRSVRPMWEIHRHRAPRAILEDMERQLASGTLVLERGELVELRAGGGGRVRATFRTRAGASFERSAARIFNCIGPGMSVRDTVDPMIGSMLRSGAAAADPVGLGLRTDDAGRIVRAAGEVDERMHLVGALRRGDLWESTAVPELRVQAEAVARALAGIARMPGGSAEAPHAEGFPEGCG